MKKLNKFISLRLTNTNYAQKSPSQHCLSNCCEGCFDYKSFSRVKLILSKSKYCVNKLLATENNSEGSL